MSAMPSNSKTKSRQGCWTCKARKVQCDQGRPTCRRCTEARRECEGYAPRLSWPRDNDQRRAIRVRLPTSNADIRMRHAIHNPFINTTFQDIELYHYLSSTGALKALNSDIIPGMSPRLWGQPRSEATHMELVHYFCDVAHHSLTSFSPTTSHIRDVIMSMIFASDTASRRALFHALLAFSSLHRSGLHRETMLFKVAALAALSASAKEASHGLAAAAQHVAACMILCSFEILLPSENSGEWILYVRGAMEVIQRARLGNQSDYGDNVGLVDWVYYHNSLSRFTLSHWRHRYLAVGSTDTGTGPVTQIAHCALLEDGRVAPLSQSRTHTILNTLSEICNVLLDPSDPRSQDVAYRNRLKALEWKVDNFPTWSSTTAVSDKPGEELEFTLQLYKTATRIYLTRASQNPLEPMANLDSSIDWAYTGALQHGNCRHFFPLLIIACEARTDEQRAAVLNLIDRTEKKGYVRSMMAFRSQVQSFWKQHDLHADSDLILNYLGLMKAVISSNTALPSYA